MFLFGLLVCVGSALAANDNCVPATLSLTEKLNLNGHANDHDNNHMVTYSDIAYDLDNNYDANNDGAVTEKEWIARWTCAFGDTEYFARFAFNIIGNGSAEIRKESFNNPPFNETGIPLDAFLSANRQRYTLFQHYGCVNTALTLSQKLDLNLAQNNHNNDTVVDSTDIAYDLNHHYDRDHNRMISEPEWIIQFCCAYGDTAAYARWKWEQMFSGKTYISASDFHGDPYRQGIPLDNFRQVNQQAYEQYAATQQSPVGK